MLAVLVYGGCLVILALFKGLNKYTVATFLTVFMTSGFVYLSAILFSLFFLYYFLVNKSLSVSILFSASILLVLTLFFDFVSESSQNVLELLQLLFFMSLLVFLKQKDIVDPKLVVATSKGFLIGSFLVVFNIFYRFVIVKEFVQEDFTIFSISNTFNYTGYYLFFGLIGTPFLLKFGFVQKVFLYVIYAFGLYAMSSRSGFVLGSVIFMFLLYDRKKIKRSLVFIGLMFLSFFLFLSSSMVNIKDSNDIIYSIYNFESNQSNIQRLAMIQSSFEVLDDHPFGWGIGNASIPLHDKYYYHPHAHNVLANWIYELGYFGVLLFLLLFFSMYRDYVNIKVLYHKRYATALVIFILISAQVDSLQYNVLLSTITFLGIMTINVNLEGEPQSHSLND